MSEKDNMTEERKCPVLWRTALYTKPTCNAKIIRREPLLGSEYVIGQVKSTKDFKGGRVGEEKVPQYVYECENGHLLERPDWWADVPTVPPGTVSTTRIGISNKPHKWYVALSEQEKEKVWKR